MPLVRSISGLRATNGDGLTPELIARYAKAFSKVQPDGAICVGRDGRGNGSWIEKVVVGTLLSMNREVHLLGIVPTPTVQLMTEKGDFAGGISITASHNPSEWNGLKFLGEDGVFLNKGKNEVLWSYVDNGVENPKSFTNQECIEFKNSYLKHIEDCLKLPLIKGAKEYISAQKLKVVVDAVNSSGSKIVPNLLRKLGYEVVELFCEIEQDFPHTPEPIPENLKLLSDAVVLHNADFGIAVDPDADRLVLVDSKGDPIGEEKTIVLSALAMIENKQAFKIKEDQRVTVNLSTSRMINDVAISNDIRVERSPVGEINVVQQMKQNNSFFGGEGSGGVILPQLHYGRDSLAGISLISILLMTRQTSFDEIVDSIKSYEIIKTKLPLDGDFKDIQEKILAQITTGEIDTADGIRIDFENSWVQIRKSNTEPIMRIIAEAESEKEAKELIDEIKAKL